MKSPLKTYNDVAASFNITDDINVAPLVRRNFAQEQAYQMQQIVNRLLFDIATTRIHLDEAKDDATKAAYQQKGATYENDLRQTRDSLVIALKLADELSAELEPPKSE